MIKLRNHDHMQWEIREFTESDLPQLWALTAKEKHYAWADYNAPYFNEFQQMSFEDFVEKESKFYLNKNRIQAIEFDGDLIGLVSSYWECKDTRWLEVGIVIYDENYWSKGLGYQVLKLWVGSIFDSFEIDRVGFTTWSGNLGMMRLGEKLGMSLEKEVRSARYYQGTYFDSIGYGVLRSEWVSLEDSIRKTVWIQEKQSKTDITAKVLGDLYQWFGIESSTQEYIDQAHEFDMVTVQDGPSIMGFASLSNVSHDTLEIHVMGVHENYHRQGIGRKLILESLKHARLLGKEYVMVRTLAETHPSPEYAKTRLFYEGMGFKKLFVDAQVWGKDSPCLILVKSL